MLFGAIAYFTPTMLAGYGWLGTVTKWPAHSVARELFYGCAMILRCAPVAALGLWLAQTGPGPAARHTHRLIGASSWRWWLREAGSAPWIAVACVFLLAFQEFDLATSWGIKTWTVALFDAQIGGLALSESLHMAILPLAVEVAVIIPLLLFLRRFPIANVPQSVEGASWPALLTLGIGPLVFFVVIPGAFVFQIGFDGFRAWVETPGMIQEIGRSCMSAGVAASLAWGIATVARRGMLTALTIPGLLGPLLLALSIFAASQTSPSLGASVVPWLLALTLLLLPVAILLRLLLDRGTDPVAWHMANLANARTARWTLRKVRSAGALLLLFCLGYGDFTIATILAPPQFTTVFPRVFNLMHYGRSSVLSVSVLIAVLTPLAILGFTLFALRFHVRRSTR